MSLGKLTAAVEILVFFSVVAVGVLCFLMDWLTPNGAVILTALLLVSLVLLSWKHFDQGRHPCFLFLCALLLLQGGRLLTYSIGSEPDPMRVRVLAPYPFNVSRDEAGLVLLCLALSAICIYAPSRWNYTPTPAPSDKPVTKYLPYLYFLFYASLPALAFKNYQYYEYAQQHGGYALLFLNHAELAAAVPFIIRAAQAVTLPVYIAIFVFERRRMALYITTILYFAGASLVLLLGQRGGLFGLVLTLWYVSRTKSGKRSRFVALIALGAMLFLVGDFIQKFREEGGASSYTFAPIEFVTLQGNSLDVTEVAIKYRLVFAPYAASYLWNELQDAFVARDASGYSRGLRLSHDASVLLNAGEFSKGYGTAGSYLAEIYLIGGLTGVVVLSLMIGSGLQLMYRLSSSSWPLLFVAIIMPDVLLMPRGQLLDWLSVLFRHLLLLVLLWPGWLLYSFVGWMKATPRKSIQEWETGLTKTNQPI